MDIIKAVPNTADFSKFVMDTSVDAGKVLLPTLVGAAFFGKIGTIAGAIAGAKWAGTSKPVAATFLSLVAIDAIGELAFGKDIIGVL